MKTTKVFVGVRFPEDVLRDVKSILGNDPEEDLSSFIRRAVRHEISDKFLNKRQPHVHKEPRS